MTSARPAWRKSSHSNITNCVEVALDWHESSRSGGGGSNCVEVAADDDVYVRDSKDPDGPRLRFTHAEWSAFLAGARDGEFDLPPA